MLQKHGEQIRACHERAAEARDRAEAIADPALRADFLEMEKRWLFLARSYEFTDRLTDFTAAHALRRNGGSRGASERRVHEVLQGQLFDQLPIAFYVCEVSGWEAEHRVKDILATVSLCHSDRVDGLRRAIKDAFLGRTRHRRLH